MIADTFSTSNCGRSLVNRLLAKKMIHAWGEKTFSVRLAVALMGAIFFGCASVKQFTRKSGKVSRTTVDGRTFTVDGDDWELYDNKEAIEGLASGAATVSASKKLMILPKVWGCPSISA